MKPVRRHLARHAVAYVALCAVLGGSAFATGRAAPKNSVGSKQVIDHSLLAKDTKRGQAPKGLVGARGPTGAAGPRGGGGVAGALPAVVSAASATAPSPPSSPFNILETTSITLAKPGHLLLEGRLDSVALECDNVMPCVYTWGLYVDGKPVPGSGVRAFASICSSGLCGGEDPPASVSAIVSVGAGTHQVRLGGSHVDIFAPVFGASELAAIALE
jgi:hypothetical protein